MLLTLIKGNADLFDPEIGNIGFTHDMQNDSATNKEHHGSAKCGHCRVLRATQFHVMINDRRHATETEQIKQVSKKHGYLLRDILFFHDNLSFWIHLPQMVA